MGPLLLPLALAGDVLGVVLAAVGTVQRSRVASRAAAGVFSLSWLAHTAAIVMRARAIGGVPLSSGFEYLLVFGWAVLGLYLYLWFRFKVPVAALILPPLAAVANAGALALAPLAHPQPPGAAGSAWFFFHTTVATFGMATLGVAFAMAMLYLFQDHALKSRRVPGLLQRLPSLDQCDHLGQQALVVGFALLTLGIGAGIVMNAVAHDTFISGNPKQVLPLIAWSTFALLLLARAWLGFRGRKYAFLTITGFLVGLASFVGMTL